ncbi:MAG: pilus assembly protein PilM, partial [Verrucomicrobia bacterium]|nr:pilus assembly protein PilM [Verrucomicrobiota bacterium]
QVNQTLQFYKGQQGGAAPQRLYLSGGASIMPYTAQFFAEKLNIPVEYFNPFRNVQIDPVVNLEELSRVAHGLGEVVGLGLRNLANCPVEMNLMPESTLRWQALNQKKPYLVATVFSLVAVLFAIGFLFDKLAVNKEKEKEKLDPEVAKLTAKVDKMKRAWGSLQKSKAQADQISTWMQQRFYWGDFMSEMRRAMIRSEDGIKKKLSAQKPGIEAGIWIEQMVSASGLGGAGAAMPQGVEGAMPPRYAYPGTEGAAPPPPPPQLDANGQPIQGGTTTNIVTLICRAVDLSKNSGDASANSEIAYAVESEIKNSPMVDAKSTTLVGNIVADDSNGTFTFTVNVAPTNAPSFTPATP